MWLGRRVGDLLRLILRNRRRTALENLAIAFPELPEADRAKLCRRAFQQLGMTVAETCAMVLAGPHIITTRIAITGPGHLRAALAGGRGALVLSAHFGNWELVSLSGRMLGVESATVVRPLDSALLDWLARRLRKSTGVELIEKRRALRRVLEALRRGRAVGILLDQNASRAEGVFVPFFGRAASTSRGLAVLALRTGAPILPVFIHREPDGTHEIVIEAPLARPSATLLEDAVEELTAACSKRIEDAIRAWPDQWLWIHRRWRTRPPRRAIAA